MNNHKHVNNFLLQEVAKCFLILSLFIQNVIDIGKKEHGRRLFFIGSVWNAGKTFVAASLVNNIYVLIERN